VKIRTRIILGFTLIVFASFTYLLQWIYNDIRPRYLESVEENLVDMAVVLASIASRELGANRIDTTILGAAFDTAKMQKFSANIYDLKKTNVQVRVYATDAFGMVVFDSNDDEALGEDYSQWNDVLLTLRGEYGARSTRVDPADPNTSILHVAAPIKIREDIVGVLTVCKPTTASNHFIQSARRKVLSGGILAGVAIVGMGIATTAWITRPIQRLTRYAQSIRDGKRSSFPRVRGSEMQTMGLAMEEMRRALDGKEYVEQYVQSLTHQLKSPLTAIRGAVELLEENPPAPDRDRFQRNLRIETDRLQRIVDRQLFLSSIESRRELGETSDITMGPVLHEVIESLQTIMQSRRIETRCLGDEALTIRGELFLIWNAIQNILQNAVEFSPDGGRIELSLHSLGEIVEVRCTDQGPGIPEYALERIFDRFYSLPRPDTGKKSSGLGLAFVREVAALHGGNVKIANLPGKGAIVILQLRR